MYTSYSLICTNYLIKAAIYFDNKFIKFCAITIHALGTQTVIILTKHIF